MEYFSKDRSDPESYLDKWDRWVRDDWHRAYVMKLGKLGLDIPPDMFERARERIVAGVHHRHAILAFAAWPLGVLALRPARRARLRVVREQVPGLVCRVRRVLGGVPPRDRSRRRLPAARTSSTWRRRSAGRVRDCASPRPTGGTASSVERIGPRTRFYCSQECQWMDESNPGRYTGDRNYLDRYHGWEASEVIRDLGFVRADGETLIGQPHLRDERRWTLADIRAPRPAGSSARTSGWRRSSGCQPATGAKPACDEPAGSGSSRSARRSTARPRRPSSTPPSARATTSSTAAARASARRASASCSRATSR